MPAWVWSLVQALGLTGVFIAFLIYEFVLNPEKGELLVAMLARLFSWAGTTIEKTATAVGIQAKVDGFIASINAEVAGLLPYYLKIKWVPPEIEKSAFIENDHVVVLLSRHQDQDLNLTAATTLFMRHAVIPEARVHIDSKLSEAIDLMMTKKALYSYREAMSSFDRFTRDVLKPALESDNTLKNNCQIIDQSDERGLFTRVILRELLELGRRRAGTTETGDTVFETNGFIKKVMQIVNKAPGTDIDPVFVNRNIRIAFIFVAKPEKFEQGPTTYLHAVQTFGINKNADTIYILARNTSVHLAKETVQQCKKKLGKLELLHEEDFFAASQSGNRVHNYCAIFHVKQDIPSA